MNLDNLNGNRYLVCISSINNGKKKDKQKLQRQKAIQE